MDLDKPQKVENFHFTQYGHMALGTRWYVKEKKVKKKNTVTYLENGDILEKPDASFCVHRDPVQCA